MDEAWVHLASCALPFVTTCTPHDSADGLLLYIQQQMQPVKTDVDNACSVEHLPQVPDVSGMIHTSDFPCLRVSEDVPDTDKRNTEIEVAIL